MTIAQNTSLYSPSLCISQSYR